MSFFNTILNTLGIGTAQAAGHAVADALSTATDADDTGTSAPATETVSADSPQVDIVAQLEARAAAQPQKLNWKTSIVDLLKLLELDSSLATRKELATELGCPAELMADSAQMNMWLHKQVLLRLAANGGNIPAELLK